jgi:hypothetical protein
MLTPTAPSVSFAAPGPTLAGMSPRMGTEGTEPGAGPRPDLGRAAVTQAEATAKAAMGVPSHARRPVPEIPPDPPPLKGLGVPGLHLREVGDFDEARDTPPPLMSDLLEELETPGPQDLDIRV